MIPQTRTDLFLAKITGEDVALPVPQTRFEIYLANIAGESYELPIPNSRATLYLAKILGQDVELPEPQTRSELYLASIAGMSVQLPAAPQTREEWYLARWAEDAGYVVITGNPVSFSAVAAKLRQLIVNFAPVQEGSGAPGPENERPISGWSGVRVDLAGENLRGGEVLKNDIIAWCPTATVGTDYVSFGYNAATQGRLMELPYKEKTRYTFFLTMKNETIARSNLILVYTDNSTQGINLATKGEKSTTRVVSAAGKTVSHISKSASGGATEIYYDESGVFEGVLTDDDFVPFAGRAVTADFGETYYGGSINFLTGVLTVDKRKIRITSADAIYAFAANSSGNYRVRYYNYGSWFANHSPGLYSVGTVNSNSNAYNWAGKNQFFTENTSVYVMPPSGITTEQEYKDWLDSLGGVEATVNLKTPIEIQLTAEQLSSLAGPNTMWSDANGDLTVEYWKDGNVSDAEALSLLLGGRYSPAQGPEDVPDREALRIIAGGKS